MNEEVALADDVEDRAAWITQLGRDRRRERWVLERRTIERVQREEIAEAQHFARLEDVPFRQGGTLWHFHNTELLEKQGTEMRRHLILDLGPGGRAGAPRGGGRRGRRGRSRGRGGGH